MNSLEKIDRVFRDHLVAVHRVSRSIKKCKPELFCEALKHKEYSTASKSVPQKT